LKRKDIFLGIRLQKGGGGKNFEKCFPQKWTGKNTVEKPIHFKSSTHRKSARNAEPQLKKQKKGISYFYFNSSFLNRSFEVTSDSPFNKPLLQLYHDHLHQMQQKVHQQHLV